MGFITITLFKVLYLGEYLIRDLSISLLVQNRLWKLIFDSDIISHIFATMICMVFLSPSKLI